MANSAPPAEPAAEPGAPESRAVMESLGAPHADRVRFHLFEICAAALSVDPVATVRLDSWRQAVRGRVSICFACRSS